MSTTLHPKCRPEIADYKASRFHLDLAESPTPVVLSDILRPNFWQHNVRLGEGDTIRIRGQRREFDLTFVVESKAPGGLLLRPWPYPGVDSPEYQEMLKQVATDRAHTEAELAAELKPQADQPAPSKKAKAAA